MVLRIFLLRKPGGEYVQGGLMYGELLYEADQINICTLQQGEIEQAFWISKGEESKNVSLSTDIHGFEILNNSGVVIHRVVPPVNHKAKEPFDPRKKEVVMAQ